jgi:hypothetical protein
MNLKIIDNFYTNENFEFMLTSSMLNSYHSYHHPISQKKFNKKNAYPCYQTDFFSINDSLYDIFIKTFQKQTGLVINEVKTLFRKTYSNELSHIFKYGLPTHQDEDCDIAGLIYYNTFGLDDGTMMFSEMDDKKSQIEPDIIIGAKPNRCVFYDPKIWHRPSQDKDTEIRITQPFFIKFK